jgi:phosphoribosylformylglycinamidine (FGAM) synthase-like enzyme
MTKSNIAQTTERDEAQMLEDVENQHIAIADARRELAEIQRRRHEMLTSASVDAIQEIDRTIDRTVTKVEIAEAMITALESELANVRVAERDGRLAANLARAQQLAEEAHGLIVNGYALAASSIAETLARLAKIDVEVRALNAHLPPGAVDVQTEAFRGYRAALGATVVLPGVSSDDANFWPARPRRLTIDEIYGRS